MEKKLQNTKKKTLLQDSSQNPSTAALFKKYGIVHSNTTEESLGKSSIIFLNRPKKG
jgi:hypothetical protein